MIEGKRYTYILPHIADGFYGAGAYYRSTFKAAPASEVSVSCKLAVYGLDVDLGGGYGNAFNFDFNANSYMISSTTATQALATGYAAFDCDGEIDTHLVYSQHSSDGTLIGEAAVFATEGGVHVAEFLMDVSGGARFAVAIANPGASSADYILTLDVDDTRTTFPTVTVSAQSNRAFLLDELGTVAAAREYLEGRPG